MIAAQRFTIWNGKELAATFSDPPAEYGPIDGWWWEAGRLDRDKLRWQLEELEDKGISGTWFYARYVHGEPLGSDPPYFSDEWWDFTRFAADEHRRLGLTSWFSNWTVLQFEQDAIRAQREATPELWGRRLVIHRVASEHAGGLALELPGDDEVLDAAAYRLDGDAVDYATRVALTDAVRGGRLEWEAPGAGWLLTAVAARPWDLDYLSPAVAERWTDVILGEYERRLGARMGETVEAFGPDEMMFLDGTTLFARPLLDAVAPELLIGLFHDIGLRTDEVRCGYYAGAMALLDESFYRPPTRWLHDRGMLHACLSQIGRTPLAQTFHYGDFFRYLGSFDVPGNEDPGWQMPTRRRLFESKMSSSVAHLTGRQRVIGLAHYGAGWGQTFDQNVAWTNAAYAKGLNLYSRHQAAYTLMGGWYEWVPPADHFYHPYWAYWRSFADYVRRLSFAMSQGRHRADVALLYPLTTIHANWVAGRDKARPEGGMDLTDMGETAAIEALFDPPAHEASNALIELAKAIYLDGIDFDFVNDESLARATVHGNVLELSGLEFRSVLLPPTTTIPIELARVLWRFFDAGGTVGAYGRLPTATAENGRDDPELRALLEHVFGDGSGRTNEKGGASYFVAEDAGRVPGAISEAIVRDVVVSGKGTFHTHQQVGDLHVYFVVNVEDRAREETVRLRVDADVERWDAFTGERRALHRVAHDGETTELRLRMEPYEGCLLVCSPRGGGPDVVEDDLAEVVGVEVADGGTPVVRGFVETGGPARAVVRHDGREYAGAADVAAPPAPMALEGPFGFRLEPTMDNRWGDFRHPPADVLIGAEARTFRYREETETAGSELGWHTTQLPDDDWPEVAYSYGPYWWHRRPGAEEWEPYAFSTKFGAPKPEMIGLTAGWEHLLGVSENFLVLGEGEGEHELRTTVHAPADGTYLFLLGRRPQPELISLSAAERRPFVYHVPAGTRAWVGDEEVLAAAGDEGAEIRAEVQLRAGPNEVRLRIPGQPEGEAALYAVFVDSDSGPPAPADPQVALLHWFRDAPPLAYDVHPDREHRVGWYRFDAPPGLRAMRLDARARGIEAWVDGEPVPVRDGAVALGAPRRSASRVALRVEQQPGVYAGAVFEEPIAFTCADGDIALGDWSRSGLAAYSGIGVYATEVTLAGAHLEGRVLLDLGDVKTVADVSVNGRSAGVRVARPFSFDITDLVVAGRNGIEIKVANTLANHMSTYPTVFVREGQTESGLLGPVRIRFRSPARLTTHERSYTVSQS